MEWDRIYSLIICGMPCNARGATTVAALGGAFLTHAKKFEAMRNVGIAFLAECIFKRLDETQINALHFSAFHAHNMVMVRAVVIMHLVTNWPVA